METIYQVLQSAASGFVSGGVIGTGASVIQSVSHNNYMAEVGERMIKNPDVMNSIIAMGVKDNNAEANAVAETIKEGFDVTPKEVGKMVESVISESITKDSGLKNIMNTIKMLEGNNSRFRNSQEAFDTAKAVMHFVQGKATDADNALLSRSSGAMTLLTAVEGNNKALKSIKTAAATQLRESTTEVQSAEYGVRSEGTDQTVKYSYAGKTKSGIKKYVTDFPADMDYATREKIFKERIATVFNLGAVKLNTDTKKIQVMGDRFTGQKNIHGDDIASDAEMKAKVNSLYDIADILSDSSFVGKEIEPSFKDSETKPKNKAHKDVKYWYKFENTIEMDGEVYDVVFNIRDKGKEQYQYLIEFRKKGDNSNQPYSRKDLRRTLDELSPTTRVSQSEDSVKSNSMHDGDIYSQGQRVSIPEGAKKSDNIVITQESERFRKKNPEGYKITKILAKDLGMRVMFVDGLIDADGNILDGAITSEGIFINSNAENIGKFVVTHEFSHRMKNAAPEAWAKYQEYVIEREKANGRYRAAYELKKGPYNKKHYTAEELTAVIDEEIACDYIGDMFSSESELAAFIEANRSTAVTVRDVYYGILDRLGLLDEKKKAQFLWRKAYKEAVLNKDKKGSGEVRTSKKSDLNNSSDGSIVKNKKTIGGEKDGGKNTEALAEQRISKNHNSIWERSNDTEGVYRSMGGTEETLRAGESNGRGFVDWSRELQSYNLNSSREKKLAYGLLRKISEGRIREKDAQGRKISKYIQNYFSNTVFKTEDGFLIPLYHATDNEFNVFEYGDFGFHVGSAEQAMFLKKKYIKEVYVNITSPLYIREDTMTWPGLAVANKALQQGIISEEEYEKLSKLDGFLKKDANSESNKAIKELLKEKGYDGIIYNNGHEGEGLSAIAFDSEQLKYVSNENPTTNRDLRKSVSGTRLSEYESETSVEEVNTSSTASGPPSPQGEGFGEGVIPPGAMPRREVVVPRSVEKGTKVRQFARTAAEAETLTDRTSEGVLENVEKGKFNYTPVSDKKAMNNAYASLDAMGVEWVENKVKGAISAHKLDKNTVAMAEALMERYSAEGREDEAQELIINFAAESTRVAQSLQAISMLKKLNPDYEVSYIDKIVENLKEEIIERNNKKWLGKKQDANIEVSEELKTKLRRAKTEEERAQIREEIYTQIAEQIPSSWIDKWNAWRYLAMLGNPRTHIRNVVGNAFFMPMIASKNISATIFEAAVDKISGGKIERTKTFNVPKEYKQFALADAETMREELSGGGKHNPSNMIKDKQRVFLVWGRAIFVPSPN